MTVSHGRTGSHQRAIEARDDPSSDPDAAGAVPDGGSGRDEELSEPVHLLVSAAIECAREEGAEASELTFSALEKYVDKLRPEVVEMIATAKAKRGDIGDAARGLVCAAERWRLIGEWSRAVALCRMAYNAETKVAHVHRTWGLALLAAGDAEGARGHLERWREEQKDEVDPQIWCIEGLWSCGRVDGARRALGRLAGRLGIQAEGGNAEMALRRAVAAHLRRGGEPLAALRTDPFWRTDPFLGGKLGRKKGRSRPVVRPGGSLRGQQASRERKPRVLLVEDISLCGAPLSRALEEADFEVVIGGSGGVVDQAVSEESSAPDVLVVPMQPGDPLELDRIREIKASEQLLDPPILGVVDSHGSAEDRRRLQALGVIGLVDHSTSPAHVVFRLNRIVHPAHGRLSYERAPAFFPVELEADGRILKEYALSLSVGGMGVTSERPFEPNTEVRLRFALESGGGPLEMSGRVVYCRTGGDRDPINEIGVLFVDLGRDERSRIEEEVRSLLDR